MLFFTFNGLTTYLFSGTDPEYKQSGAASLLVWEGIQRGCKEHKRFDFDGSMIESIEKFFRGFGATPVPYMNVRRFRPAVLGRLPRI
jgi:hypothetical protein